MNTKEIMELIADYQTAVENLADYEARWAYIEPDMFQHKFDSYAALRTAIEELHRDATKWREYKARKDAVIAAGMGRNPLRETVTCNTYGVINEDGEVEYAASWPEACHDHIKDMQVEHGIGGKWKVRALKYLPVKTPRKEST